MNAYEGAENYIFISYAHKDSATVIPIIEDMDRAGFRIWYDSGIEAGSEWPEYIESHLLNCSRFLAFISPSSVASPNCRNEINLARAVGKEILVVYLEPTELTGGLFLQLNSVQSLNKHLHPNYQSFMDAICRAKILECCKAGVKLENPLKMQPATPTPRASEPEPKKTAKKVETPATENEPEPDRKKTKNVVDKLEKILKLLDKGVKHIDNAIAEIDACSTLIKQLTPAQQRKTDMYWNGGVIGSVNSLKQISGIPDMKTTMATSMIPVLITHVSNTLNELA